MRTRGKTFLSCALFGGGLLGATVVMAADPPPLSCTTTNGWYITATAPVSEPCPGGGTCTAITYSIPGVDIPPQPSNSTDHVATLVDVDVVPFALDPPAAKFAPACGAGDTTTGLGVYACHEQAVRLNQGGTKNEEFRLVAVGNWVPVKTTMLVKKGKSIGSCLIVGLGGQTPAPVGGPVVEILKHGPCAVEFTMDGETGAVLSARLLEESEPGCKLTIDTVENLQIYLGGQSLGLGQFGNGGYFHSGSGSCTTRVVGGKVYSWGSPCPQ